MAGEKLDSVDRRILYELDLDSRQPISRLAKKLRMSSQRLDYRISALEKSGVIMNYFTIVDYRKLGHYHYYVYNLRVFGVGTAEEDRLLKNLIMMPDCTLIFRCEGRWDLLIGTVAKSVFEAKENFARFLAPFRGKIDEGTIIMHIGAYHYGFRYLVEGGYKEVVFKPKTEKKEEKYGLTGGRVEPVGSDELDLRILRVLSSNARAPTIEIAKAVSSTPETVSYRIREMEKKGVIRFHTVNLRHGLYGYSYHRIYVRVDRGFVDDEELIEYMNRFPNLIRLNFLFGSYDFLIDLVVESDEKLRLILSTMREHYKNTNMRFESCRVYTVHKFAYFATDLFSAERAEE